MTVVRRGTVGDITAILAIWNAAIRNSTATFTSSEKTPEDITARLDRTWVADQTDQVVGFATFGRFRDGPGYAYVRETSIYLHAAARGHGVGRELMAALERDASNRNVTQLIAAIGGENSGAEAFHAALGFTKVAQMPEIGWKFDRWHDLILMQKKVETPH